MAASLCLLLFAAIFPTVLGQELHIDVAIGETAKFPLRSFTNFDDRKMLGLALVNDTVTIELVTLAAGAPVQNAIIHAKWQGRLSLLEGPDGIEAELKNFQPSDTGREVYYQYQQRGGIGPKMYANIRIPPPAVSSFSITNAGEDYVNITWKQVEPLDSAPVWYHLEYREADVNSETWHQTANISATDATDQLTTRVEGLLPAVWYEFRVVASNRFGQSRSATKKALTKGSGKRSASYDVGMAVGIPVAVAVLIILGIVLYVCRQRISQRCRKQRDEESGARKEEQSFELVPTEDTDTSVPSDVEVDASKDCFEAEITGEETIEVVDGSGSSHDLEAKPTDHTGETGPAAGSVTQNYHGTVNQFPGTVTVNQYYGTVHHYYGPGHQCGNHEHVDNDKRTSSSSPSQNIGPTGLPDSVHTTGSNRKEDMNSVVNNGTTTSTGQGQDNWQNSHRTPQNNRNYVSKVNIVGNMQIGDNAEMNIRPQSGPDNNMDAESTSAPAPTDAMTRVVKEEDFQDIQEHIGLKWKDVAERLGLSDGQIDGVEHDNKEETLGEKVYQMLRKWKQVKGDSATVAVLILALKQEGLHDVADRM